MFVCLFFYFIKLVVYSAYSFMLFLMCTGKWKDLFGSIYEKGTTSISLLTGQVCANYTISFYMHEKQKVGLKLYNKKNFLVCLEFFKIIKNFLFHFFTENCVTLSGHPSFHALFKFWKRKLTFIYFSMPYYYCIWALFTLFSY